MDIPHFKTLKYFKLEQGKQVFITKNGLKEVTLGCVNYADGTVMPIEKIFEFFPDSESFSL